MAERPTALLFVRYASRYDNIFTSYLIFPFTVHTVDGRNPAPVDTVQSLQGVFASQIVQDFFHQQYFDSYSFELSLATVARRRFPCSITISLLQMLHLGHIYSHFPLNVATFRPM